MYIYIYIYLYIYLYLFIYIFIYIYILFFYIPGTQVTLVLVGKGLVLRGLPYTFKNRGHLGSRYVWIWMTYNFSMFMTNASLLMSVLSWIMLGYGRALRDKIITSIQG